MSLAGDFMNSITGMETDEELSTAVVKLTKKIAVEQGELVKAEMVKMKKDGKSMIAIISEMVLRLEIRDRVEAEILKISDPEAYKLVQESISE